MQPKEKASRNVGGGVEERPVKRPLESRASSPSRINHKYSKRDSKDAPFGNSLFRRQATHSSLPQKRNRNRDLQKEKRKKKEIMLKL